MPPRRVQLVIPPHDPFDDLDDDFDGFVQNGLDADDLAPAPDAPRFARGYRPREYNPGAPPQGAAPAAAADTTGDAALARRLQLEADHERDAIRRAAAARRAAIQQVQREEEEAAREQNARLQRLAGGGHFALGRRLYPMEDGLAYIFPNPGDYPGRPRAWNMDFLRRGIPPELLLQQMRAQQQEQSVQDSWGGINFVPRQNPLLGFTFDFDKDADAEEPTEVVRLDFDDDAPIIEELRAKGSGTLGRTQSGTTDKGPDGLTSLVCASCYLPLRVSQGQRNEGDRVFALRCGHLVDKRCLDDISQPKPEPTAQAEDVKPGFIKLGSGATSRKDGNFVVHGDYAAGTPVASTSALPRIASPSTPSSPLIPIPSSPVTVTSSAVGGSSRIPARTTRSAARLAAAPAPPVDGSSDDSADPFGDFSFRSGRGRPRGGKKRKAAPSRASKPIKKLAKPEEKREYKWLCPVVACGREHYSEEIGGVWKPKDGMITQLFV
ncbi:hypothetical protein NCC49_000992 [Naganishia albida]|nr:hypothetical protein NCC49_000992 [Naganishia albida]